MQIADCAPARNRVAHPLWSRIEPAYEADLNRRLVVVDRFSAQRFTRDRLRSIGFSQRTGLPAATACSNRSACVSVAEAMSTASTSGGRKDGFRRIEAPERRRGARRPPPPRGSMSLNRRKPGALMLCNVGGVHGANSPAADHGDFNPSDHMRLLLVFDIGGFRKTAEVLRSAHRLATGTLLLAFSLTLKKEGPSWVGAAAAWPTGERLSGQIRHAQLQRAL